MPVDGCREIVSIPNRKCLALLVTALAAGVVLFFSLFPLYFHFLMTIYADSSRSSL
jgi:hypothetical protein